MLLQTHAAWFAWLVLGVAVPAVSATDTLPTPASPAVMRAEIARGAAAVADVTVHKYPYATTHRLIRSRVEKNLQEKRDSDGFRLGAHVAAGFWVEHLPVDITWRPTALARHRDQVYWLLPRVGLSLTEVAAAVARGEGLPKTSRQNLLTFLEAIAPPAKPTP